jgi:NAD(P)-dependent dehydrogenase (short-subunit alcohol dehydrogenase family)
MANALIWGGAGGIGGALVRALSADDWHVAAISRKIASSDATVALEADVTIAQEIEVAVLEVAQTLGEVDLFAYAVGDIAAGRVATQSSHDWTRILSANLTGAFLATRASLPLLTPNAHLIYIGALPDNVRRPGLAAYAAAKAGLEAFAAVVAKEEPNRRVTIVRPGAVATPLWDKLGTKPPRTAAAPDTLAAEILAAHHSGHQGLLDG